MTRNQLTYQQNLETKRANLAKEAETARSNRANEGLEISKQIETHRANYAQENLAKKANKHKAISGYISSAGTLISGIGSFF